MNHEPSRLAMLEAINRAASIATMFEQAALLAAAELIRTLPAPKPPEPLPWLEVAADPRYAGRHPLHDCRYIVTKGAELFLVNPGVDSDLQITGGSIVARLTDCARQRELAFCMAAGPDLLAACKEAFAKIPSSPEYNELNGLLEMAIEKASGPS